MLLYSIPKWCFCTSLFSYQSESKRHSKWCVTEALHLCFVRYSPCQALSITSSLDLFGELDLSDIFLWEEIRFSICIYSGKRRVSIFGFYQTSPVVRLCKTVTWCVVRSTWKWTSYKDFSKDWKFHRSWWFPSLVSLFWAWGDEDNFIHSTHVVLCLGVVINGADHTPLV